MAKIVIENSTCKIEGISAEVEATIKSELRYLNQNISFSYQSNQRQINRLERLKQDKRFSSSSQSIDAELTKLERVNRGLYHQLYTHLYKKGVFPTGLLPLVKEILEHHGMPCELVDLRKQPEKNKVKYVLKESFPPMRYYQKESAKMAADYGRGIIVAPTGTGKTLTMCRMIWELGVKTLIITPSKAITDNMVDALIKHFGKGQVAKLNTKSKKISNINVCNIQALVKVPAKLITEVDAVFIDEFHHAAAETYQEVNLNHLKNTYYRIGVTATNFRNDGSDLALEAVLSEVLYEYSIAQAIKDGFLVKPEFQIIDNKSPIIDGNYQREYKDCLVNNVDRNALIAGLTGKHKSDSVIVLVQQVEHGELLKKLIPGAEFIHGQEKDSDRQRMMENFRKGKIKCLIGTSVIGEGVDLPIANVLIMAGGGKSRSQIMQNVGRVLRPFANKTSALVYDFADEGTQYLSEHSRLRREIYEVYK